MDIIYVGHVYRINLYKKKKIRNDENENTKWRQMY